MVVVGRIDILILGGDVEDLVHLSTQNLLRAVNVASLNIKSAGIAPTLVVRTPS
jgi:hypothetical protein